MLFNKAQIKHTKNFSIKNFGAPKTPPSEILYVWAFPCVLKGKETPNIKNLKGSWGPLAGGSRRGVSGKILYVYAFFQGLIQGRNPQKRGGGIAPNWPC